MTYFVHFSRGCNCFTEFFTFDELIDFLLFIKDMAGYYSLDFIFACP